MSKYISISSSGVVYDLKNFGPEMVRLEDIAHHLSGECRYANATRFHYPVSEHSVLLASVVPPRLKRVALFHDAAEAWTKDMPCPQKDDNDAAKALDKEITDIIFDLYGLDVYLLEDLHEYDKRICVDEMQQLMPFVDPAIMHLEPLGVKIVERTRKQYKQRFLEAFAKLFPEFN